MREIKFRCWDIVFNKMRYEKYLWDIPYNELFIHIPDQRALSLMQYTGMKDKNGKEIYEGDIVITKEGYIGLIELGTYDTDIGFNVKWITDYLRRDLGYWLSKIEVIGNIYENPELMEM